MFNINTNMNVCTIAGVSESVTNEVGANVSTNEHLC